jgi:hypothetical protein
MLYVRMTDKAMSGWGIAANCTNVLVVACDTHEQAYAIAKAAGDRREMRRIGICLTKPKSRAGVLHTHKHVSELAGHWLDYIAR